jgi:hypothetical protein
MLLWSLIQRKLFTTHSQNISNSAFAGLPRRRQTVRLVLEELEDRDLLSASPSVLLVDPNVTSQISAALVQWSQLRAAVQQDLSNALGLIAQDFGSALRQWQTLVGIPANTQTQSVEAAGPRQVVATTTTAPEATHSSPSNSGIKPELSDPPPPAGGFTGYLWDPTKGNNASTATNWDYNGQEQNDPATAKKPGDTPDAVEFNPAATANLHGNGAAAIYWDYNAKFPTMYVGGSQSAYTGRQTIEGVAVELTGSTSLTVQRGYIDEDTVFSGNTRGLPRWQPAFFPAILSNLRCTAKRDQHQFTKYAIQHC